MAREQAAHSRIHDHFVEQIRRGVFEDGRRLPTEAQIAEEFGVSRATVQFAMSRLAWDGWIERFPGRGTYASAKGGERRPFAREAPVREDDPIGLRGPGNPLKGLDDFAKGPIITRHTLDAITGVLNEYRATPIEEYIDEAEPGMRYRLMSFGIVGASEYLSEQLEIEKNMVVLKLERTKVVKGYVMEIEQHYFAPDIVPQFDTADMELLPMEELLSEDRIGENVDRVEVVMNTVRMPTVGLTLTSILSASPQFIAKWLSTDGRAIVVTDWTVVGSPQVNDAGETS